MYGQMEAEISTSLLYCFTLLVGRVKQTTLYGAPRRSKEYVASQTSDLSVEIKAAHF